VSSRQSLLPQPRGESNAQLYEFSRNLTRRLEVILGGLGSLPELAGLIDAAQADADAAATEAATAAASAAAANTAAASASSAVTTLNSTVAQNSTDIVSLLAALEGLDGSGVTPQQAFAIGLVTAVDTVLGSVSQQVKELKQLSENLAKAAILDMIQGRTDGAAIRVEQAVRTTETTSLAQQITTLTADLGNASAAIVAEQIARAGADTNIQSLLSDDIAAEVAAREAALSDEAALRTAADADEQEARIAGDEALAADITTLTTSVNGNTSQITVLAASIDGIEGRFGVAINLNGEVVGLIQLDGTPSGSTFTVVADKFQVAQRDVSGGSPVPVFTIANVSGTAKLVFRGDMIGDGAIIARAIAAESITADKVAANAITADKIDVTDLAAVSGTLGSVTTGRIQSPDGKLDIRADGGGTYIRLTS
jgi:hypothetical protein